MGGGGQENWRNGALFYKAGQLTSRGGGTGWRVGGCLDNPETARSDRQNGAARIRVQNDFASRCQPRGGCALLD